MTRATNEPRRWGTLAVPLAAAGIVGAVATSIGLLFGVLPSDPDAPGLQAMLTLAVVAWGTSGALIGRRRPENPVGLVLAGEAFVIGLASVLDTLARANPDTWLATVNSDGQGYVVPMLLAVPLLLILYPTGRPPTSRWNVVLWLLGVSLATGFVGMGLAPEDPVPWSLLASVLASVAGATGLLASALAVVSVVVRYRRSRGDERQQMRWLALIVLIGASAFILLVVTSSEDDTSTPLNALAGWLFVLSVAVGLPAAIGIAIVRHGLWDIDVVIKKALVAVILTGLIVVPSLVVFAVASTVLTGVGNATLTLIGGLVIGALLVPALRVARHLANRLTYGKRATPYELMTAFGQRASDAYSIDEVLPRLAQLLADGLGASSARVLLRVGPDLHEVAAAGAPRDPEHVVAVTHQGEEVGSLAVAFPPNDPLDADKERVIGDLAGQAGPVLRNVRLIEDLRASRQRLVAAQDEERRKIERNLHDGVQQQLVALNVQLGLLARIAGTDAAKTTEMASLLQSRATEALEDLRDLARGIYPPLLADRGLTAAVEAQARKAAVPTTVEADGIERYSRDVEAAVYFCVLEALNNVAKYADADSAAVRLARTDGRLIFEVRDDGRGFDPVDLGTAGTGLQGMADRMAAIDGDLAVQSTPGTGTTIRGTVRITERGER